MKFINKLFVSLIFILMITSCEEEKSPSYDQLMEEHEEKESFEFGAKVLIIGVTCYYIYKFAANREK